MEQTVKEYGVSYLMTRIGLCFALALAPVVASAAIIEVNPDNYSEHEDLSHVSPYVTLGRSDGNPATALEPVYATASESTFGGATGGLAFGKFGSGEVTTGCIDNMECYMGLTMTFHQPVLSVSLLAVNVGYPPGVLGYWQAFDSDGIRITNGHTPNIYGEPFDMTVAVPHMRTLIVGGAYTPELEFDHLRIEVPEAAGWPLAGFGILGLYFLRRRRLQRG